MSNLYGSTKKTAVLPGDRKSGRSRKTSKDMGHQTKNKVVVKSKKSYGMAGSRHPMM